MVKRLVGRGPAEPGPGCHVDGVAWASAERGENGDSTALARDELMKCETQRTRRRGSAPRNT